MKKMNRILTILVFILLYIPMAVLVVASFNSGKDITRFEGFTFHQYGELFKDDGLLGLLGNSILVSILASLAGDEGWEEDPGAALGERDRSA